MKRNIFIVLLISIGVFGFFGCNLDPDIKPGNKDLEFYFDEKTFDSEWKAWEAKNIKNYSFTMAGELPHWNFSRVILMIEYKVNIIVKDGVMNSFKYIGDVPHEAEDGTIVEPEFTSISDMYEKISDRAKEEKEWWEESADEGGFVSTTYNIEFDPQLHYITFFEPVIEVESGFMLDTTAHAVTISNFKVLDNK